jgi:hypothetical protein
MPPLIARDTGKDKHLARGREAVWVEGREAVVRGRQMQANAAETLYLSRFPERLTEAGFQRIRARSSDQPFEWPLQEYFANARSGADIQASVDRVI